MHSCTSLAVCTLRRPTRLVAASLPDLRGTSGDIETLDSALEHLQSEYWLIERYFMSGLVDSRVGEVGALLDLAMYDVVGGADVFVAGA